MYMCERECMCVCKCVCVVSVRECVCMCVWLMLGMEHRAPCTLGKHSVTLFGNKLKSRIISKGEVKPKYLTPVRPVS